MKFWLSLLLLLALGIFFFNPVQPTSPPIQPKLKKNITLKQIAAKKVLPKSSNSSHPCLLAIDVLVENSLEDLLEFPEEVYLPLKTPACQKHLQDVLKNNPALFDLQKRCLQKKNSECDSLLFFLKNWAVAQTYPDIEADEKILTNKLMYNYTANPSLPLPILKENLKILDELISLNPSLYGAYKSKLIHLFAQEFQYKLANEEEFADTLEILRSLKSDPEIDEILLIRAMGLNKQLAMKYTQAFMSKYPNNFKGPYYRAAVEWNFNRNIAETKNWLEKALKLSPKNPQITHSIEKLAMASPGDSIFYFSLNFDLGEI